MLHPLLPMLNARFVVLCFCYLGLSFAINKTIDAQETAAYFKSNCASCHTIGGGRLTGPDLKGVLERAQAAGKDREWLIEYMQDPQAMINSGDAYAAQLLQEARGVVMTKIVGLDATRAAFLLDLIEAESILVDKGEGNFKGQAVSLEPFTQEDVRRGKALFTGREKLSSGTAMCMSCHRMSFVGGLGGGNLGPDLTRIYEGGQFVGAGRAALTIWLGSPDTPTMNSLTKDKFVYSPGKPPEQMPLLDSTEIRALVALMENQAAKNQPKPVGASMVSFSILGLLGSALILFVFDSLWKTRLRSVRRTLVEDSKI